MKTAICLLTAALAVTTGLGAEAPGLRVGAARVDLTPRSGTETMIGMGGRQADRYAVHDPLFAKVVVFEQGDHRIALVSLDLIGAETTTMSAIRAGIRDQTGMDHVICALTHTHGSGRPTPAYAERIIPQVIDAATAAVRDLSPAQLSYGSGELHEGYNRRRVKIDGKVEMQWNNRDRTPRGPTDPEVGVLVARRTKDDTVIATLVNYSVHPVISMNFDELIISADYPGVMAAALEAQFGGLSVFLLGAAGDINPFDADMFRYATDAETFAQVKLIGHTLAREVARVIRHGTHPIAGSPLTFEKIEVPLADRAAGFRAAPTHQAEVNTLAFGDDFALATIPGELFVELGLDFKARSPTAAAWIVANTNDSFGYLPTLQATTEGGYGATSGTRLEVGAGEKLIHAALVSLHHQTGAVKPLE